MHLKYSYIVQIVYLYIRPVQMVQYPKRGGGGNHIPLTSYDRQLWVGSKRKILISGFHESTYVLNTIQN